MSSDNAIDEAVRWRVRLASDAVGQSDFLEFEAWVAIPKNREAFDRLDRLEAEIDDHADAVRRALTDAPRANGRAAWPRVAFVAAALAAAAALVLFLTKPPAPVWTTYTAPSTASLDVTLADGTVLHLNRRAHVDVAMTPTARLARMDGEVAFDVAHSPQRPFQIAVGDQQVRVVGTEFNVLHYQGQTTVTVRRGIVEVALPGRDDVSLRLLAGDQSAHRDGSGAFQRSRADPDAVMAWREGHLVYADAPLATVVADLNRYYDKPIRIRDADQANLRFSGVLVIDAEDKVIARLEAFLPVDALNSAAGIELRPRASTPHRSSGAN